jgi:hypothetical protein
MSLFVVYVKDTGHVVGAVRAIGATLPTVAALVGDELPLRVSLGVGEIAGLTLKPGDLAVHEADDEPDVFVNPLAFGVEQGQDDQPPKPALVPLPKSNRPLKFENPGLTVAVDTEVNENTTVRVLISYGQVTNPLRGQINKDGKDTTLPTPVDDDPHGVLVLVPGWAGRLEKVEKQ